MDGALGGHFAGIFVCRLSLLVPLEFHLEGAPADPGNLCRSAHPEYLGDDLGALPENRGRYLIENRGRKIGDATL